MGRLCCVNRLIDKTLLFFSNLIIIFHRPENIKTKTYKKRTSLETYRLNIQRLEIKKISPLIDSFKSRKKTQKKTNYLKSEK